METILAIDIKCGLVMKAFAGFRCNYKPLFVKSTNYSDPFFLINSVKKKMNLHTIYIADLDSIEGNKPNYKLIEKILLKFSKTNFLIDSGFNYPQSVFRFCSKLKKKRINNYEVILGTETIKNYHIRTFSFEKKIRLSLDFNGSELKWGEKIKKEKKSLNLIFMFLNKIGGRGIDLKEIRLLLKQFKNHSCVVAGGIKHQNQIEILSKMGVHGVISSTLIHKEILGTKEVPRN